MIGTICGVLAALQTQIPTIIIMEGARDFLFLAKAEMLATAYICLVIFVYSNILFLLGVQMMYSVQILNQQVYSKMLIQQPPPVMISTLAFHSSPTGQINSVSLYIHAGVVRFYESIPSYDYLFCGHCTPVSVT